MKSSNPFSPDFGTPPAFFGRERYLAMMRTALEPGNRADRVVLIEGVRGTGKTALLGRLRQLAKDAGWEALYVTSTGAAREIAHDVMALRSHRRVSSAGVSVAGFGATLALESTPASPQSLRQILLHHLEASGVGLLLLIDEMQKIEKDDAQEICDALNAAREEGYDVALVMAGLPGTMKRLETFEKCTYMIRAHHLFLSPLSVSETRQAVDASFGRAPEMVLTSQIENAVVAFTSGHPYLIQLVGYDLYEQTKEAGGTPQNPLAITSAMLEEAQERAYASYAQNVLRLVFDSLGDGTLAYLEALVETMDERGVMRSDESIAQALGKKSYRSIANYRTRMVAAGILRGVGKGKVKFRIPFIPRFLKEGLPETYDEPYDEDDDFPMN